MSPSQRRTSGATAAAAGSAKWANAASAQPGSTSVSSLSNSITRARAASIPALAAAQKPRRRGERRPRTCGNSAAAALTEPSGEPSSTTTTSVPLGAYRVTLARQARSKSGRLWLGMTIDNSADKLGLPTADEAVKVAPGVGRTARGQVRRDGAEGREGF